MSRLKKALEKAKKARGLDDYGFMQGGETLRPALKRLLEKRTDKHGEVHVDYSQTRVVDISPQTLKNNKIVATFHEDEMTDQLKILRTQLLNKLKEIGGNSLLVTSANPYEGKTFISINLAVSIAHELDRTVLLVDADLRHPSRYHYNFSDDFFGVRMDKGLSDYLLGHVEIPDILLNPGIQKLTILPGGKPLPNSSEVLGSARMEALVTEMKGRYSGKRIVIFDSASLLTCTDPVVLSRFVDGVLLVVEAEKTSPDDLKRAMELLEDRPILGTVLNKAKS